MLVGGRPGGQNDSDGFVLAAQPGKSFGLFLCPALGLQALAPALHELAARRGIWTPLATFSAGGEILDWAGEDAITAGDLEARCGDLAKPRPTSSCRCGPADA